MDEIEAPPSKKTVRAAPAKHYCEWCGFTKATAFGMCPDCCRFPVLRDTPPKLS